MKIILKLLLIFSLLIITACDGDSSPSGGGGDDEPQIENLCSMSFEEELTNFDQNQFMQDLATEVGGDPSQIDIVSVSQRGIIDIDFVFVDVEGFPSVNELLIAVQSVTTVGGYLVTVTIQNLSDESLCTSLDNCNLCGGNNLTCLPCIELLDGSWRVTNISVNYSEGNCEDYSYSDFDLEVTFFDDGIMNVGTAPPTEYTCDGAILYLDDFEGYSYYINNEFLILVRPWSSSFEVTFNECIGIETLTFVNTSMEYLSCIDDCTNVGTLEDGDCDWLDEFDGSCLSDCDAQIMADFYTHITNCEYLTPPDPEVEVGSFSLFPDITAISMTDESGYILEGNENSSGCWEYNLYNTDRSTNSNEWSIDEIEFQINDVFPNPFHSSFTIPLTLYTESELSMLIVDSSDNYVCTILDNQFFQPGNYSFTGGSYCELSDEYYRLIIDFGSYECFQNLNYISDYDGYDEDEDDCVGAYDECGVCDGSGPEENFDCDGNCVVDTDCAGVCGGSAEEDECGDCGGDGSACACTVNYEGENYSGYYDCSGDGDCCPVEWLDDDDCDGTAECWGCDMTCYDNDGGDCDGINPGEESCFDDEELIDDCDGSGDPCPESWIGDGVCDGEDQEWGCDLTCYDNDGGDCNDRNNNATTSLKKILSKHLNR